MTAAWLHLDTYLNLERGFIFTLCSTTVSPALLICEAAFAEASGVLGDRNIDRSILPATAARLAGGQI